MGSLDTGTSASQPIRGRQTQNSLRAGQAPGNHRDLRACSQEPIAQRVEYRIIANRQLAQARHSAISENPSVSFDSNISTLQNTQNTDMTGPTPVTTTGASGSQSQSTNIRSYTQTSRQRMPKPGEKNAPTFDPEKPEELGRFFDRIEDWFKDEGLEDDTEKKTRIVKYLDPDSEIQWKAFPKFLEGTFHDFKAEVMESYPEAEEVMKGSVTALKRKIKKLGPVAPDDKSELSALIRVMTAEVMKLKSITPPIHTNRELVELFLERLTPDFASRVASKLSVHRSIAAVQEVGGVDAARNPEDMYDITEVMAVAKQTALEQGNPFGKYIMTAAKEEDQASVKLEEAVARLTDTINLQHQYNKQVEQKLASLQNFSNQPRQAVSNGFGMATRPYDRGMMPSNMNQGYTPGCFYCAGSGHRIPDCEHARRHLDLGWIKKIDRYLKMPDGQRLQPDGNKSMKEIIEGLNSSKPGIIPMSKIGDKSSLYQDTANVSTFIQGQSTDGEGLRSVMEMIQRLGVDKVQKFLSSQIQAAEEEEQWNQNFD